MGGSFPGIVAAFLILSAVVLYLMRKVMARAGVDGWAWLPEDSQFKTYERQLVWSKLTAGLVAIAGLVFLGLFPWQR